MEITYPNKEADFKTEDNIRMEERRVIKVRKKEEEKKRQAFYLYPTRNRAKILHIFKQSGEGGEKV